MGEYFDDLETRDPAEREADHFRRLPTFLAETMQRVPGLASRLGRMSPGDIDSPQALARVPVLRKPELMELQAKEPPFGGIADVSALAGRRVFLSPGPVWEPQGPGADPGLAARAFFAAGIRPGDVVHNAFAYQMTPGGFILDEGARALGCTVFPAGVGNTEMQVEAAAALKPTVYCGTPDFLKVLLDKAAEARLDLSSFRRALVSGGALFPALREEYRARGVAVFQCYATAEFGVIAYETAGDNGEALPGMILNEELIVEIVRPGTDDPVKEGEVGEIVVTSFNPAYPLLRFGTGDLSAILPGQSPCGRTGRRIKGWMGRADQRTKIKGMFVDPKQVAEIVRRHPEVARARLVVSRAGASDRMELHVEPANGRPIDADALAVTLREVTKLGGSVLAAEAGSLPNDGKVVADERDYSR